MLVTSLVASLAGCAQILGIEDVTPGPGNADAAPADATPATDASGPPDSGPAPDAGSDFTCADQALGAETGTTAFDTDPAGNDLSASCGGDTSPDLLFSWTAPVTDYYVFDTFDSGFDTVLSIYDECGGNELACSNNIGESSQSEIVRRVVQGESAVLLVDGAAGDSGQGMLAIERVSCPDADIEEQDFPLELSTLGFGDELSSSCGGQGQEDRAYHWRAPADGLYYFRATADNFKPVVSLIDGPRCDDLVLGCNAAQTGEFGAEVVRFLRAGQMVSVVVDGLDGAGLFTLDIGLSEGPECPESSLAPDTSSADDFSAHSLAPSCAYGRASGAFGGLYEVPDKTYALTVPGAGSGGFGSCFVQVEAPQEVVLYALTGSDCGGAEVSCEIAADSGGGNFTANINLDAVEQDTDYTVVVADRYDIDGGGFVLSVECAIAIP